MIPCCMLHVACCLPLTLSPLPSTRNALRYMSMQLSKSEYMMYLKHPAWLWLKKHDKNKLPEVDANLQAMFDAGHAFEWYAEQRFSEGVKLGFDNYQQYQDLPERTQKALNEGAKAVFQGRFLAEELTCICDVIVPSENGTLDLYEIKSSTKVKEDHEYDLAFQVAVLERAGYEIGKIHIIHVNKYYKRKGDIDPEKLTVVKDITEEAKARRAETETLIAQAQEVIKSAECPDISPRHADRFYAFSEWMEIYKQLVGGVEETSIYNLYSPGAERIAKLEDAGIKDMADIPEDFDLTNKQRWQIAALKKGEQYHKQESINKFLKGLEYPLYFLDYETLSDVVPPFEGMHPYEQLPFQYSLHVIESPGAEPKHYEYLHTKNSNPVPPLVEQMQKDIGDTGNILVWWQSFEKSCNELMAKLFPEYESFLNGINERIRDLMDPFMQGWFVDYRFGGSASIKNVLPVLAPELSYKELDIQEGGSAQRLWMDTVLHKQEEIDPQQLFEQLRRYCALDTLAMVKIYEYLAGLETQEPIPGQQASLF